MSTRAIVCQINAIGEYVADGCLSAVEMKKILDALDDAHLQIQLAKGRLPAAGGPRNEGVFG